MIGKCANIIVDWLIKSKVVEENEKELYSYALYNLVLSISPLLLAIGFGLCMRSISKSVVVILPFMIIRKYSGGYHTKHLWSCLLCSSLSLFLSIILSLYLKCGWLLALLTIGAIVSLVYFSPIDNENRTLSKDEKVRYKKTTIILLFFILLIDVLLFCFEQYAYSVCISVGIMLSASLQFPCILKNDQKK